MSFNFENVHSLLSGVYDACNRIEQLKDNEKPSDDQPDAQIEMDIDDTEPDAPIERDGDDNTLDRESIRHQFETNAKGKKINLSE